MKHLCLLLAIFCCRLSAGEELAIADKGKSPYRIVLPDQAAPVLHTAASELSEHLAKITGAPFPVISIGIKGNINSRLFRPGFFKYKTTMRALIFVS